MELNSQKSPRMYLVYLRFYVNSYCLMDILLSLILFFIAASTNPNLHCLHSRKLDKLEDRPKDRGQKKQVPTWSVVGGKRKI